MEVQPLLLLLLLILLLLPPLPPPTISLIHYRAEGISERVGFDTGTVIVYEEEEEEDTSIC